jgi:hypothetical protein
MCHALTLSAAFLRRRIQPARPYHRGALRSVGSRGMPGRLLILSLLYRNVRSSHGFPARLVMR